MMDHLKRFAAELCGTFTLCMIAILAMAGTTAGDSGRLVAAMAYGLGVMAAMHAFGTFGAVHLNPAVTLAIFATGRGSFLRVLACIAGQLIGACLAGLPFTGAAMNPARALASAVAAIDFSSPWLCVCGSLAGGTGDHGGRALMHIWNVCLTH
ncbi:MAG: aquaporin, partial [Planctomycetota bacterium]